jgi:hypothetical protein
MNSHHAVLNLASIAVVLPAGANGLVAALCNARLVHAADGSGVSVVFGHNLLAAVTQLFLIPFDGLKKPLQRPCRSGERQGDCLGGLAMQVRELAPDIDMQQSPRVASPKAICEQRQKRNQLPSKCRDLL